MAGSVNKVLLVGNLGRDPEIRHTQDGRRIAQLSIATSESWRDKVSGERKEKTEWHRVVVFNEHLVEVVEKYARKGSKLWVEGSLQTRKWTDQQGAERYSTEVVLSAYRGEIQLLDSAGNGSGNRPPPAESQEEYGRTSGADAGYASAGAASSDYARRHGVGLTQRGNDLDDEIPF